MDRSQPIDGLIDAVLTGLRMSRGDLAAALEVTERSIDRWYRGKNYPQYESRARLDELRALAVQVAAAFDDPQAATDWLHSPNAALGDHTPVEALRTDQIRAVAAALARDTAR